jgi:hypothetical protein
MPQSAYVSAGEGAWRATELTRGPWDPQHQHGGPPIALLAREIARLAAPLGLTHFARLTANLLRPVPIADELAVAVQTDYAGRNAAHFSAVASSGGKEVLRGTALVLRETAMPLPEGLPGHPLPKALKPPAESPAARFPFVTGSPGYPDFVESRVADGVFFRGPSSVWFRLRHPLIEGETPLPIERVAVAADSGNGISAILDFRRYVFVNSDLTVNLLRRPEGEWICLEAHSLLGPMSTGLAEARIYDERGLVGRSTQSLVIRPRA